VKFSELQGNLGTLLEKLLDHLNKSLKDLISKEVAANIDFADFKIAIERENEKLENKISHLSSDIKAYKLLIDRYNNQGTECIEESEIMGGGMGM